MSVIKEILDNLNGHISQCLKDANVNACSVHIRSAGEKHYARYQAAERVTTDDDDTVFPIGSLVHPIIAAATVRVIKKMDLQDMMLVPFTVAFNKHSEEKLPPWDSSPTLRDLLTYSCWFDDKSFSYYAPEGTLLTTSNTFLGLIARDAKSHRGNGVGFSHANYILIALFLKAVTKKPLHAILKEYIFQPLQMRRTYMSVQDLQTHQGPIAKPYRTFSDGSCNEIPNSTLSLDDIVDLVINGGYSCVEDLGLFFGALSPTFPGDNTSLLDQIILLGKSPLDGFGSGYTAAGLYTSLDKGWAGSLSFWRRSHPEREISRYRAGKMIDGNEVHAYYLAGGFYWWPSVVYLLPDRDLFIVILANTTGFYDAPDFLSKYLLSEILNLQAFVAESNEN